MIHARQNEHHAHDEFFAASVKNERAVQTTCGGFSKFVIDHDGKVLVFDVTYVGIPISRAGLN